MKSKNLMSLARFQYSLFQLVIAAISRKNKIKDILN